MITHKPLIGILEWFHQGDKAHVHKAINQLDALGIKQLRTGISWADYYTPQGEVWLEWLIPNLVGARTSVALPALHPSLYRLGPQNFRPTPSSGILR